MNFHYPKRVDGLNDFLEEFKKQSRNSKDIASAKNVNNGFVVKAKRGRLIVMDDVSGLADESKKFASFLAVARKYNYRCANIFHTIYPEKATWRKIPLQTNILNSFPATVPLNSVKKILEGACNRKKKKYILNCALWTSRLFIELANRDDRVCLTLDCSNTNRDVPKGLY